MADARRMGKSELFAHFADRFEMKRAQARELFEDLSRLRSLHLEAVGKVSEQLRLAHPPGISHRRTP